MSRESHQRYIEKAALREAQRAFGGDRGNASIRDFLTLRVQTIEPWKRIACVVVGTGFGAFAVWLASGPQASAWAVAFFAALALFTIVVGAVGWKRPVEAVLDVTAEAVFRRLFDAL